jgi:hypothetical protein
VVILPCALLTVAAIGYATGHSSVAEVVYFLLFLLLAVPCALWMLRDRAAVSDQVLLAVDDAGVYLADPARRIPWPEVAGLVAFRTWQESDGEAGKWVRACLMDLCGRGRGARS